MRGRRATGACPCETAGRRTFLEVTSFCRIAFWPLKPASIPSWFCFQEGWGLRPWPSKLRGDRNGEGLLDLSKNGAEVTNLLIQWIPMI